MYDDVRARHPRPQFIREAWSDLCGEWGFAHDDADTGIRDRWMTRDDVFGRTITVPFPPESEASGIHDPEPHPVVWYRREIDTAPREGMRTLLHFGAVDYAAQVWVNGHLVATHAGGHTPFSADITDVLEGDRAVIVVRAKDDPFDMEMPRGKQDWQTPPHDIWYFRTTGIWQPVWLEYVPATRIGEIRWTPDIQRGVLGIEARIDGKDVIGRTLRVRLSAGERDLADETITVDDATVTRGLDVFGGLTPDEHASLLWSPEQPTLIDAEVTLLDGDQEIDRVLSYAGMRDVETRGGAFHLNGRPYFLRMVLEQGYWPESHLAAPSVEAIRREVELTKELGFNGARIHQKVEDPRFLYWCDRLGLVIWGEMANAYRYSPDAVDRFTREWLEVVRRDYSHPCIVAWVPLNESWGVPDLHGSAQQRAYLSALYHLTKALDTTRPVISNDGWEHVTSDIWSIHDYVFEGDMLRQRYGSAEAVQASLHEFRPSNRPILVGEQVRDGQPVMITEYGGISFAPKEGEAWFGYGTVTTLEDYAAKVEELTSVILASTVVAGFCYTQLTDTEQETNGLLTANREFKIDPERIRAIMTSPSAAIPDEVAPGPA